MNINFGKASAALIGLVGLASFTAEAQKTADDVDTQPPDQQYQSGYDKIPQFGGPDGPSAELKRNDEKRLTKYEWEGMQRAFAPYFDWKRWLIDEYGVSFGMQFYLLGQYASTSLENKDALGSIFRFNGSWTLLNRGSNNPGRIEWRLETRSNSFGRQAPMTLSGNIGAAALNTGFPYTQEFDLDLAVINWTQGFRDSTVGVAVGRLAFDVYLDAMPFQTIGRGFINRGVILNPSVATTGIGAIGAVAKGMVGKNFWVGGQIHDANAKNGEFDLDTVQEGEWLSAIEVGWTPSFADRNAKRVQFTYWHKDRIALTGTPSGKGWAVSAAWKLNERYFPFLRFGHSDGGGAAAAESAVSVGVEITRKFDEIWSLGFAWAKPAELAVGPDVDDEYMFETSYKIQLAKNFSITPDLQILFNPANNPAKSSVIVGGIRFILTL